MDSSYHFSTGGPHHTLDYAYEYCAGLGLEATYLWCPGNVEEALWVWAHHPDQPWLPYHNACTWNATGIRTKGLWTGIFSGHNHYFENSTYYCGTNHTHYYYEHGMPEREDQAPNGNQTGYFEWRTTGYTKYTDLPEPHFLEPEYQVYYQPHVAFNPVKPRRTQELQCGHREKYYGQAKNWAINETHTEHKYCKDQPIGHKTICKPEGVFVCEMNCDMVDVDPVHPEIDTCKDIPRMKENDWLCEDMCFEGECICENCYTTPRTFPEKDGTCRYITSVDHEMHFDDSFLLLMDDHSYQKKGYEALLDHGCHCPSLVKSLGKTNSLGLKLGSHAGEPIDALDAACAKLVRARICIFMPGGPCEGYDPETSVYYANTNKPFKKSWMPTAYCQRYNNDDKCMKAMCELDLPLSWDILNRAKSRMQQSKKWGNDELASFVLVNQTDTCPFCEDCVPGVGCMGGGTEWKVYH